MKKFNYIDRLKGFAILLVVMGHVYLFPMHPNDNLIFRVIQSFHMPLFLFLSGFVISRPNLTTYKRKAIKYLLPMFVFGTLFSLYMQQTCTWSNFVNSLSFLAAGSKNGYWYFLSLTMFYFTLFTFNICKKRHVLVEIVIPIIFYVAFYVGWRKGGSISEILSLEHAVFFYPFYVLGYLSRKYNLVNLLLKNNWVFTIALVGYLILMNLEKEYTTHNFYSILTRYVTPTMAIIMCLFVFVRREKDSSVIENQLAFWGRNTLSIYVLHFFIIYKINMDMLCPLFEDNNNTFILLLLITMTSIAVTYCSIYVGKFIKTSNLVREYIYSERVDKH